MGNLLLDTTVLIDFSRGRGGVHRRIEVCRRAGDELHVCPVSIDELYRGSLGIGDDELFDQLIGSLKIVEIGRREGERSGRWRRQYSRQGVTLQQPDSLIAAAAAAIGGRLATGNPRHFPMDGLVIEHWPVGER
jgi:predicted nucleic acid-binding protein